MNNIGSFVEVKDEESQLLPKKRKGWLFHVLLDIPLFVLVSLAVILYETGLIPTHMSGFFCNDPALSFEFRGDTVPMGVLVASVFLIPPIVVFITEVLYNSIGTSISKSILKTSSIITGLITRDYLYGFMVNLVAFELLKALTGMPRPTFFDLCEPDAAKTCVGSEFISEFTCTSTRHSQWLQQDSYHSFPSGHTSLSVYAGLFVAWYLQIRAFSWSNKSSFLVPFLQILCICFMVLCSITRITDHRHHWWDVAVGALIGLASVYFAIAVVSKNFAYIFRRSGTVVTTSNNRPSTENLLNTQPIV